jgi:hypothetical protein
MKLISGTTGKTDPIVDVLDVPADGATGVLAAGVGPGYARQPAAFSVTGVSTSAVLNTKGVGNAIIALSGTFTGLTFVFEGSFDGTNYVAINALNASTGSQDAGATTISTGNKNWLIPAAGNYLSVRCNVSAVGSGTAVFTLAGQVDTGLVYATGDVASGQTDAGYPVKVGGLASGAVPGAVSSGQRVAAFFDLAGRLVVASKSATGTQSIVAGNAGDVTILAANTARLGATIYNDSTAFLYLLLANTTSSATVFTVKLAAGGYYEVPFGYAGVVKGIWSSAAGNARVTELT